RWALYNDPASPMQPKAGSSERLLNSRRNSGFWAYARQRHRPCSSAAGLRLWRRGAAGMHELIQDITFSIVTAWILGVCAQFFRQPPILAYLAGGFLLGPFGLHLVRSEESIHVISELGL